MRWSILFFSSPSQYAPGDGEQLERLEPSGRRDVRARGRSRSTRLDGRSRPCRRPWSWRSRSCRARSRARKTRSPRPWEARPARSGGRERRSRACVPRCAARSASRTARDDRSRSRSRPRSPGLGRSWFRGRAPGRLGPSRAPFRGARRRARRGSFGVKIWSAASLTIGVFRSTSTPSSDATRASFARRVARWTAATERGVVPLATSRREPSGSVTRIVATVSGMTLFHW